MRINRSLLNWGVFLIALGGVPLAVQQGWAESGIAGDLWRVWPLILVGIGLGLILRWTPLAWLGGAVVAATFGVMFGALIAGGISGISSACISIGSGQGVTTTQSGTAAGSEFRLDMELSCGELNVTRGSTAQWSVSAEHSPDQPPVIAADASGLTISGGRQVEEFFVFSQQTRNDMRIELPATASLSVETRLSAADGTIDLGAGPVARLEGRLDASDVSIDLAAAQTPVPLAVELTLNASSGRLTLSAGSVVGSATLNASAFTVCLPASAQARIEVESTLAADDLADSGLVKSGAGWQTPGYDTAATRIELSVTSTVSSLSVERPEVCP